MLRPSTPLTLSTALVGVIGGSGLYRRLNNLAPITQVNPSKVRPLLCMLT
jgi:hypothetical protein